MTPRRPGSTPRSGGTQDAAAAPPALPAPRTSSVLSAEELAVINAGLAARHAQAAFLQQRAAEVAAHQAARAAEGRQRAQQQRDAIDLARLSGRPRGPNLPAHLRRTPRLFVQEEDLEDVIPDGWGRDFREDASRLGERIGIPAVAVQLLTLLEWFHGLRSAAGRSVHGTGGGLQASPEWLARKLGCSERWVQKLVTLLDPWAAWRREAARTRLLNQQRARDGREPLPLPARPKGGAVYLQRFPQLRRYSTLTADLPPAQRMTRWLCREGRLHEWVDLTGVLYVTAMGCRVLRRRARQADRKRPGRAQTLRRSPMQRDLYRRLAPLYRRLRARLAPAVGTQFTPNNVTPYVHKHIGPRFRPSREGGTGPPSPRPSLQWEERPRPGGRGRDWRGPPGKTRDSAGGVPGSAWGLSDVGKGGLPR